MTDSLLRDTIGLVTGLFPLDEFFFNRTMFVLIFSTFKTLVSLHNTTFQQLVDSFLEGGRGDNSAAGLSPPNLIKKWYP